MKKNALFVIFLTVFASCAHNQKQANNSYNSKAKPSPKKTLPLFQITGELETLKLEMLIRGIGFVHVNGKPRGTATCIARKIIVTAAHLAYDKLAKKPANSASMINYQLSQDRTSIETIGEAKLKLLAYDGELDLALYEIDDPSYTCKPIPLSNRDVAIGDVVYRFGFTDGWKYVHGVCVDKITRNGMRLDSYAMHRGPGASGGPVLSTSGELVEVHILGRTLKKIYLTARDEVVVNIEHRSSAVPLNVIKKFLQKNLPENILKNLP